ncbi:MAG: hypothetical protein M3T55_02775, partial [Pseudomonadota bacterium]|nr:hypothetical protein [Pseudomonadota bacterium]
SGGAAGANGGGGDGVLAMGPGATVSNSGTIAGEANSVSFAATGDVLIARAGAHFIGAIAGGGGTFELAGGRGTITGLGGAGVVSGSVSASFGGFAHYAIGAKGSWTLGGVNAIAADQSLTFDGALDVTGRLSLAATRGTLTVDAGGSVVFSGLNEALAGTIAGAGTVAFTSGSVVFNESTLTAAHLTVSGAAVTLIGQIVQSGTLSLTRGHLAIGAGGAILTGGGTLALSDSQANTVVGLSAADPLQNFNTISGAGMLGAGQMDLINRDDGVIVGSGANALIIDTGANLIANAGLIEATRAGGVVIDSVLLSSGLIEAAGGMLTVNARVIGLGQAAIAAGALIFNGAFSQNVTFSGTSGFLELAQSQGYGGSIAGFSKTGGTSLDLRDIAFKSAGEATFSGTASSGTLTVTDGTHTAHITLIGDYLGSTFTASSDGHGGTTVIDPRTRAPSPHPLIAAMASLGAGGASLEHLAAYRFHASPTLLGPRTQLA